MQFDNVPYAVLVVDSKGRVITSNNAVTARFGWTQEELAHEGITCLVPGAQHAAHVTNFFAAPEARGMNGGRALPVRCKDGSTVICEITLVPTKWHGHPAVCAVMHDVTLKLQAKQGITELNNIITRIEAQLNGTSNV
jgi:two-component system sensor kinase FixL